MSKVQESSDLMQEKCAFVAGPREWFDTRESWLARGARASDVTYRQFKAAFYGEIDAHHEVARKIAAVAHRKKLMNEARTDARETIDRLLALRRALAVVDADFHCEAMSSIDDTLRALGVDVRAGNVQGD